MSKTTLAVKMETKERLETFGTLADTYDSLLNKFMDHMESCSNLEVKVIQEHKK